MLTYLLVPSPLLGPATWDPVAAALRSAGARAEVARVDDVLAAADGLTDVVLVPHSNAGLRASWWASLIPAAATVYVDAALPPEDVEEVPLASSEFRGFLAGLAGPDGVLPPWSEWWDDVEGLFPHAAARAAVEEQQPRLSLAWFDERVPVAPGWAGRDCAYLAFGDTYAEERAFASSQGWPTTTIPGQHLHQLHAPTQVAEAIQGLVAALASGRPLRGTGDA
ncbi:hypothetical protein ABIE44_003339 [Marmoricola sp. OAE513]|uniref:hypothetical protein n=1 Tax=Marmoricola sp. OAE513 TaxID=2817894 RepID=UPI001AE9EC7B